MDDDAAMFGTNDPLNRRRRGSDPNADNYSEGVKMVIKSKRPKRQRK